MLPPLNKDVKQNINCIGILRGLDTDRPWSIRSKHRENFLLVHSHLNTFINKYKSIGKEKASYSSHSKISGR